MQSSSVVFVCTSSFVVLVVHRRSIPATKWLATKGPRYETAGDELYPRQNRRRRSVPATKWQATKQRRRNGGDKTAATKGVYPGGRDGRRAPCWEVKIGVSALACSRQQRSSEDLYTCRMGLSAIGHLQAPPRSNPGPL